MQPSTYILTPYSHPDYLCGFEFLFKVFLKRRRLDVGEEVVVNLTPRPPEPSLSLHALH